MRSKVAKSLRKLASNNIKAIRGKTRYIKDNDGIKCIGLRFKYQNLKKNYKRVYGG